VLAKSQFFLPMQLKAGITNPQCCETFHHYYLTGVYAPGLFTLTF
jgi:hypothetical protein